MEIRTAAQNKTAIQTFSKRCTHAKLENASCQTSAHNSEENLPLSPLGPLGFNAQAGQQHGAKQNRIAPTFFQDLRRIRLTMRTCFDTLVHNVEEITRTAGLQLRATTSRTSLAPASF